MILRVTAVQTRSAASTPEVADLRHGEGRWFDVRPLVFGSLPLRLDVSQVKGRLQPSTQSMPRKTRSRWPSSTWRCSTVSGSCFRRRRRSRSSSKMAPRWTLLRSSSRKRRCPSRPDRPTGSPSSTTPAALSLQGRYGVRARIENEGRLLFASTQFNSAFGTNGSPAEPTNDPVKVLVSRVPSTRAPSGAPITGTRWVLQSLGGKPAGLGAGGRAPDITLQGSESRAAGFAGCNQITGGYTLESDQLSFGQMAMTRRACADGMELERDFAKGLQETKSYRIEDDTLSLRDENGTVVAVLRAG